ncbi:hypothetical protein EYR38_006549 [Pleurotus pulmonarius]|nr:hypothetical protein EYR38_006549 [Pleurotus pulmonarius]
MHDHPLITPPTSPPQTPSPWSSSPPESPNSPSVYGPPNPYNQKAKLGHMFLARRDRIGSPTPIDQWLQANLSSWSRPDARSIGVSIDDEEVTCDIDMRLLPPKISRVIDPDDPFTENTIDERYVLVLAITMPPSSIGPLVWHRTSPPIILDRYSGEKSCLLAPDWCRSMDIGQTISFTQPRYGITEFAAQLAITEANQQEGYTKKVLQWAEGASVHYRPDTPILSPQLQFTRHTNSPSVLPQHTMPSS